MKENTTNPFNTSGFSGTNPTSPAFPQYPITVFSHLPETRQNGNSYYVYHYPPIDEEVHTILEVIKQEKFKTQIDELRLLYSQGNNEYTEKKKELPIIMFNGRFSKFAKERFISPSGLFILDFDHIPDNELITVWNSLVNNQYVFSAWLSPSGHGYKVLVKVKDDDNDSIHKEYFRALSTSPLFPIQYIDKSGSDISRCCFFSSDPDLYLNDKSKVWTQRIAAPSYTSSSQTQNLNHDIDDDEAKTIINYLEGGWSGSFPMTPGNRHNSSFLRARELAEWGVPEDAALAYMLQFEDSDFKEYEITQQVRNAYKKTEDASKIGSKYTKL